jgi:hypothetical protein
VTSRGMGEIFTFARLRPIAKLGSFNIGETIAHRRNKTALDFVVYAPLGLFLQYQAWRKNAVPILLGHEPDRLI